MNSHRLFALFSCVLFAISAVAQTQIGAPPFSSTSGGPDVINLGNLNVHLDVPILSKPGRGIPFNYVLRYDGLLWYASGGTWNAVPNYGWRAPGDGITGWLERATTQHHCIDPNTGLTVFYNQTVFKAYHDIFGTRHPVGALAIDSVSCNADSAGLFPATANDGSGYSVNPTGGSAAQVFSRSGQQINPSTSGTFQDANGNEISATNNTFYDTLSSTTPVLSVSGGAPNPMVFTYKDTAGANQTITVSYLPHTVQTEFQCAGITDNHQTTTVYLIDKINYDFNNTYYQFTYEATPSATGVSAGAVTGRIASVRFPTGGVINYSYSGGNAGIVCSDGSTAGLTRQTPEGTWTYTRANPSGSQWTTTVQAPDTTSTAINFQVESTSGNYYETKRTVNPASPLRTTYTCYNGTALDCSATAITLPITQVSVTTQLDNNEQSRVNSLFESGHGLPTETDEYDFGAGAPGPLLRKSVTTYATLGNDIFDHPFSVEVQDGAASRQAYTTYGYDETAATGTSGIPQHVGVSGSRGNLTSINEWRNLPTVATLSTTLTYDDTGNVLTAKDPGGHTTSFAYSNSNAYVSQVTLPATTSPNAQTHITSATYDSNTGLMLTSTDQNGKVATFQYDGLLRPTNTYFPDATTLQTQLQYQDTSQVWTWNYLDATNHTDFRRHIDSLGRMDRTAFLNQEGSWDMQDTCFDSNGRPAFTSLTYQDANGWGDPSRCSGAGDGVSYDGLNRPKTVTHSDGSQINYTYAGRATRITDEGNGNGTMTVQRILQSDGLGRLTNVCEVSGTTLLGSGAAPATCNLDYTGNGFLTTYGYNTLNDLTHVDQGSLAVRTYVYDSLSRMTSEQFPEQNGNTTTYTYDSDSLLATRVRPAPNNGAGNVTTTYTYDQMHRPTGVSYTNDPSGTRSSTFNYDEAAGWGGTALSNPIGRMTTAYAGGIPGVAASMFAYDANGRVSQNWQCTPRTCGSSPYYLPYSYDRAGDILTASNGAIGAGNATFTYNYNAAARLTSMTSSLVDATHPATLLSNAHYGPFGVTNDTLGNGLNETYSYHARGWLQNAFFGGTPSGYGTGAVQYSGSEQVHNATTATGSVTVSFSEPAPVQVQTYAGAPATGYFTMQGGEQSGRFWICNDTCVRGPLVYDTGGISVTAGTSSASVNYNSGSTLDSVGTALAGQLNGGPLVYASYAAGRISLTAKSNGVATDYALSTSSYTNDPTDFGGASFWTTPSGANMTGGADPTYQTVYDTGTATLCIGSNCGYTYAWNQNDNATTVATNLAAAVQRDPARAANASATGAVISFTAITAGTGGNLALSASSGYDTAHFGGPAATFSTSGMGGGTVQASDTGTATLTVAGITEPPHTWGNGDTALNIANDLAAKLNADPNRQANAISVTSCGLNCSQINLQALTQGPNPSYNGGISHSDTTGYFPSSSFNASPTASTAMLGGSTGTPSLYSYALTFAPDGSITGGNDSANGNWSYGYDEFNRLTSASKTGSSFTYAYDRLGNRWQQNNNGTPNPGYTFDTNNHIQPGSGVTYDALGNVLNDGLGNSYLYDAENRVASVNGVSYVYDAFGRRVKTPSAEYLYDLSGNAVSMLDPSTGALQYGEIYAGGRHIATYNVANNTTAFLYTDWLGSLRAVTNPTGSSLESCTNLPFGDGASCTGTDYTHFHFTGDEHDATGNLEHTLFRQLSTTQGRWLTPDPSGMAFVDFTNPESLNMYGYVLNHPVRFVDPLGLDCGQQSDGTWVTASGQPCTLGNGIIPGGGVVDVDGSFALVSLAGGAGSGGTNDPLLVHGPFNDHDENDSNQGTTPTPPITGTKKVDPNSQECQDLAAKIANISRDIEEAENHIMVNPAGLPLFAPGQPPGASVQGHVLELEKMKANLQQQVGKYSSKCGGGGPPAVAVRPPVLYPPGFRFPGVPRSAVQVGVGTVIVGTAIIVGTALCPECALAAAFGF